MNYLNLTIGTYAKVIVENTDEARITRQDRKSLSETKAARTARKRQQIEQNQFLKTLKDYCMDLRLQINR